MNMQFDSNINSTWNETYFELLLRFMSLLNSFHFCLSLFVLMLNKVNNPNIALLIMKGKTN